MKREVGYSPQVRLRRRHEQQIFHLIRTHRPISRSQLTAQSGLSAQAVGNIVRDFLERGLIVETAMARQAGPGASPIGLDLKPDGAYALGFGLERDSLRGVALDLAGQVVWQMSTAVPPGEEADATLSRVEAAVRALQADPTWAARWPRVWGMGMAVPGPIDRKTGTVVRPPNLPGWDGVPVIDRLSAHLGLPVVLDNAATAAAVGVEWRMRRRNPAFLFCYWGLGIGGGLVIGDEAYRGLTGNAMELGHIVVKPDGRACECGGRGCLEAEASVTALLRDAAEFGRYSSVEDVVRASRNIPALRRLLTNAAELLGVALVTAVNLTDVSDVIVGSEHFHAVERIFLPVVRRIVEGRAFRRGVEGVRVRVADVGEEANAIGAATLVFHALLAYGAHPERRMRTAPRLFSAAATLAPVAGEAHS